MIKVLFPHVISDIFPDTYLHIDIMEDDKVLHTLTMEPYMVNGVWDTSDVVGFLEMHGWESLSEPTLHDDLVWSMEVERIV